MKLSEHINGKVNLPLESEKNMKKSEFSGSSMTKPVQQQSNKERKNPKDAHSVFLELIAMGRGYFSP